MKVILFRMNGCPWCEKMGEELKDTPLENDIIYINKTHMSAAHKKLGISKYPTLVFLNDKGKLIDMKVGFLTLAEIKKAVTSAERLEKIIK